MKTKTVEWCVNCAYFDQEAQYCENAHSSVGLQEKELNDTCADFISADDIYEPDEPLGRKDLLGY
jgi:hypothetical protein